MENYAQELANALRYVKNDTSGNPTKIQENFNIIFRHVGNAIKINNEQLKSNFERSNEMIMALEKIYMELNTEEDDESLASSFILNAINKLCI
jgi:hypothetical protein